MADELTVLRSAIMRGESIESDASHIIISAKARLDRKIATNFHSMRGRGPPYSLEAVYFQYKHHQLPYNDYVTECNREQVPHVTLVDKKELIAFLKGDISECACLVAPSVTTTVPPLESSEATVPPPSSYDQAVDKSTSGTKFPHRDESGEADKTLGDIVAPRAIDVHALSSKSRDQRALDSVMCVESWDFSALRDKLGKHIEQTRAALASGKLGGSAPSGSGQKPNASSTRDGQPYDPRGDRYTAPDDRFWRENMGSDFYEMGIDPSGTFKSSSSVASQPKATPAKRDRPSDSDASHRSSSSTRQGSASKKQELDLKDQIPIIIVPISTLSMLTFHNAREFLERGSYVSMQELRSRGSTATAAISRISIMRRPGGHSSSATYEIVCNPLKLTSSEWKRVVAVVCTGQAWQFKNWPWWENDRSKKPDNGISEIFSEMCGFVLHYDDSKPPPDTKNWAVKFLAVSRTKRHNDVKVQTQFWEQIDAHCKLRKRNLLY